MASLLQPLAPFTAPGQRLCTAVSDLGSSLERAAETNDRAGTFARESVLALGDAGVLAACAPEVDGGSDLTSLHDLALVIGRIAEHDASIAIGASMHLGLSWYFGRALRAGLHG